MTYETAFTLAMGLATVLALACGALLHDNDRLRRENTAMRMGTERVRAALTSLRDELQQHARRGKPPAVHTGHDLPRGTPPERPGKP